MDSFDSSKQPQKAKITGLYRHAVKGLSADSLQQVVVANPYDTFPDDRRFALLYEKHEGKWQEEANQKTPGWLHKENFLCAFTDPHLMAKYEASYRMVGPMESTTTKMTFGLPWDTTSSSSTRDEKSASEESVQRILSLKDRASQNIVWGPEDLATEDGRASLGDFFSQQSGHVVQCISSDASRASSHPHQFGNTSSGWKHQQNTRTIHLINANTVQSLAEACQTPLDPTRFRPNIVVEGWEPWEEFKWIGKRIQIQCSTSSNNNKNVKDSTTTTTTMNLLILSKTVRCAGVSVDPLQPDVVLDIPKLLTQHFPEHGPYIGVYAVIEDPGVLSLGDEISFLS